MLCNIRLVLAIHFEIVVVMYVGIICECTNAYARILLNSIFMLADIIV